MHNSGAREELKPATGIRSAVTQDGAVLLDINQGLCFSMNPVGAKIWELLKINQSIDQIADALATEFSIPREQVFRDVREFIAQLRNEHLLVPNRDNNKRKTSLLHRILPSARARDDSTE